MRHPLLPSTHPHTARTTTANTSPRTLRSRSAKFTHSGSIVVRATVRKGAGFVEVEVADTGIGIPESKHKAIFGGSHDPFVESWIIDTT